MPGLHGLLTKAGEGRKRELVAWLVGGWVDSQKTDLWWCPKRVILLFKKNKKSQDSVLDSVGGRAVISGIHVSALYRSSIDLLVC